MSIWRLIFKLINLPTFSSASEDTTVALWDLRNTSKKLHTFEGHQDHVIFKKKKKNASTLDLNGYFTSFLCSYFFSLSKIQAVFKPITME